MSSRYTHRNLVMWQKAQELAYQVSCHTRKLPQNWTNAVLVRQIVSSAYSVGTNIAEGHGRYTLGAHRNHLLIARGSAAETDSWLDGLRREGCITAAEESVLVEAYSEIIAMLTSKVRMLDQQTSRSGELHEEQELYQLPASDEEPPFPFSPEDYI